MLWPVTSSACCWARMPRSVVSRPMKVEIGIALDPGVEDAVGLRRGGRAHGRVAGLRCAGHHAHQVVEEGKLLADQDLVLSVHARDLAQEATQLGALLARQHRLGRREQMQEAL